MNKSFDLCQPPSTSRGIKSKMAVKNRKLLYLRHEKSHQQNSYGKLHVPEVARLKETGRDINFGLNIHDGLQRNNFRFATTILHLQAEVDVATRCFASGDLKTYNLPLWLYAYTATQQLPVFDCHSTEVDGGWNATRFSVITDRHLTKLSWNATNLLPIVTRVCYTRNVWVLPIFIRHFCFLSLLSANLYIIRFSVNRPFK